MPNLELAKLGRSNRETDGRTYRSENIILLRTENKVGLLY